MVKYPHHLQLYYTEANLVISFCF